jgi:hypothetical protein
MFKKNIMKDAHRTSAWLQPISEKKYTLLVSRTPMLDGVKGNMDMTK